MTKSQKLFYFVFYYILWKNCACEYLDVKIDQGIVRGYDSDEVDVFSFYGIPYATAPKGVNKFQGPLPPPTWTDIFNATERLTICLQQNSSWYQYYNFKRKLECLNINIFKPKGDAIDLPVFVSIHGGALVNGHGMNLSPIALTKRGMVTVTFNYRLGTLGFMCLGTKKVPGNAGMKDQVAALKWIQRNIKYFGGNPKKVTIAGSSSAASTNELLVVSPTTNGLFSQAILESGTLLHTDLLSVNHLQLAIDQASYLGADCNNTEDVEEFYTSLEDEVFNANLGIAYFSPCVEANLNNGEERFLVEAPIDTLVLGNYNKVPLIVAFAPKEALNSLYLFDENKSGLANNLSQYLPNSLKFETDKESEETIKRIKEFYFPGGEITKIGYIDFFTDIMYIYTLYVFARLHSRNNTKVFLYVFNFRGTISLLDVDLSIGQGHIPETLYYLEHDKETIYDNMTHKDRAMRDKLRQYYSNFIKYGNPNLNDASQIKWQPFNEDDFFYMAIDEDDTLGKNPMKERFAFWNKIYDKQFHLSSLQQNSHSTKTTIAIFSVALVLVLVLGVLFLAIRCKTKSDFKEIPFEE